MKCTREFHDIKPVFNGKFKNRLRIFQGHFRRFLKKKKSKFTNIQDNFSWKGFEFIVVFSIKTLIYARVFMMSGKENIRI